MHTQKHCHVHQHRRCVYTCMSICTQVDTVTKAETLKINQNFLHSQIVTDRHVHTSSRGFPQINVLLPLYYTNNDLSFVIGRHSLLQCLVQVCFSIICCVYVGTHVRMKLVSVFSRDQSFLENGQRQLNSDLVEPFITNSPNNGHLFIADFVWIDCYPCKKKPSEIEENSFFQVQKCLLQRGSTVLQVIG